MELFVFGHINGWDQASVFQVTMTFTDASFPQVLHVAVDLCYKVKFLSPINDCRWLSGQLVSWINVECCKAASAVRWMGGCVFSSCGDS